ncbi:DUF3943 domain-containing protein [Solimonas sp. K1W22B-7]|uniref:DUF3943 domain-containing protein n=1 Tax=Solimonas sp. K1W22B-7 TaxID=2303331 RepID=UPI000E332739|nr:DUF3943 domain-containing protein [Solimonas sp. K1W22B-7]AXQ30395.1 DUF3943 domain-containing protein [Solimonas sp. K1W22B-7]
MPLRSRMNGLGRLLPAMLWCIAPPVLAEEELDPAAQQVAPTAFNNDPPAPVLDWGVGEGRSYWTPAAGIVGFQFLLNQYDRHLYDQEKNTGEFDSDWDSIERNFKGSWVYDDDPFLVNQFGHPYQGSIYHNFARSAGLGYWESLGYTVLGSALWEVAGETTPPSINDQITTGFGGSFLGESLFRLASLVLESGNSSRPGFWRELGAAAISPATGFNRWAFGQRFDGVFRSHDPAVHTAAAIGANINTSVDSNVNRNPVPGEPVIPQSFDRGQAAVDFNVAYGLPGKPGYRYERPFDYFHFQFTATTSNLLENVITRGLLYGEAYEVGDSYRGIWGLYGSYDFIAPQVFRVSTTAASLGTHGQWWLSETVALQGTVMGGVGYGSGGVIRGQGDRDYHNGITPQGLLSFRMIFGNRMLIEATGREYYISDMASDDPDGGSENISRGDVSLTLRVKDLHGVTLRYVVSHREARYPDFDDTRQTVGAISLGYTYLGHRHFGAVDWRPGAADR